MERQVALQPEELLAESDWVHRLARRLVGDPGLAADLAQEALVLGLERSPAEGGARRAWLGGVLRNLLRQARRTDRRREAREVARPEPEPGEEGLALLERLELHSRLLERVRNLDEPYRTVVLLRFLEDLPPKAIAARLNVPVKTVHTRLERALERLRGQLDREYGQRGAWALLALRPGPPSLGPLAVPLTGWMLMKTVQWALPAAVALLVGGLFWQLQRAEPGPQVSEVGLAPRIAAPLAEQPGEPQAELGQVERSAASAPVVTPPAAPSAAPEPLLAPPVELVSGQVLDLERRPVSGLEVRFQTPLTAGAGLLSSESSAEEGQKPTQPSAPITATSGPDGRFSLPWPEFPANKFSLVAEGRGLCTFWSAPLVRGRALGEIIVWVGPARSYAGLVVDQEGRPVPGADLRVRLSPEQQALVSPGVFTSGLAVREAQSDLEGGFDLGRLAYSEGLRLIAACEGYDSAQLDLPPVEQGDLLLTLNQRTRSPTSLAGRVLDPAGEAVPAARVGTETTNDLTDDFGRFELDFGTLDFDSLEPQAQRIRAIAPGYLPVECDLGALPADQRYDIEIVLGRRAGSIQGRVLRPDGSPEPKARVWTSDGERFGNLTTEFSGMMFEIGYDLEALMHGGKDQRGGREARTDDEGRFELTGLLERNYTLWAQSLESGELSGPHVVASPSSGQRLELSGQEPAVPVAGRVTSLSGDPLVGIPIHMERRLPTLDGTSSKRSTFFEPEVRTDADGRFAFPGLCIAGTELVFERAPGAYHHIVLEKEPKLEDIWVALPAPCRLRVTLSDPKSAETLQLLDAAGRPLMLSVQVGEVLMQANGVQISDGISDWIETDESAVTLRLYGGTGETRERPITLKPGQENLIEW